MNDFDVVIIGSGFGGSVSAMRLSQKGYRVAVLETGKRYRAQDFPTSNWDVRRFLWAPLLRCFGFQKITLLKGLMVLHGTGVGGGSLVYANTLMKPVAGVFKDPLWPRGTDWERELRPHYEMARRMLGVTTNPKLDEGEDALRQVGTRLGCESTFQATEVGVFFGEPGERVRDPYFSGDGPDRQGCRFCGGCMVGCRFEAKNTLDYNYLYFAEKWGARVFPGTSATRIVPTGPTGPSGDEGYRVETRVSTSWRRRSGAVFSARKVIVSAGVLGTVELLARNRDLFKTLPRVSGRLGDTVRTNGESLLAVTSFEAHRNLARGIAIGAAIHPDEKTKIEQVRYSPGSSAMRLLGVPLTPNGSRLTRPLKMLGLFVSKLPRLLRLWTVRDWAKSTIILLVMQSVDSKLRLKLGRSVLRGLRRGLQGEAEAGEGIPTYLPIAQKAAEELSQVIGGEAQNAASEVLLRSTATAHILGGCCMGASPGEGVVDVSHEVFGHPGLYVCDGSVIPVNLAVNPSLTITALAERFCSLWKPAPGAEEWAVRREIRFSRPSAEAEGA